MSAPNSKLRSLSTLGIAVMCGALALLWPEWRLEVQAIYYKVGTLTDLGTLGGSFSSAQGINDRRQVVGTSSTVGGASHAFIWSNGVMTDLGTLGGPTSTALAINDGGEVVGLSSTTAGLNHAFLWQKSIMTDLGVLPGDTASFAAAINNKGQAVGYSWANSGGPAGSSKLRIDTGEAARCSGKAVLRRG